MLLSTFYKTSSGSLKKTSKKRFKEPLREFDRHHLQDLTHYDIEHEQTSVKYCSLQIQLKTFIDYLLV